MSFGSPSRSSERCRAAAREYVDPESARLLLRPSAMLETCSLSYVKQAILAYSHAPGCTGCVRVALYKGLIVRPSPPIIKQSQRRQQLRGEYKTMEHPSLSDTGQHNYNTMEHPSLTETG